MGAWSGVPVGIHAPGEHILSTVSAVGREDKSQPDGWDEAYLRIYRSNHRSLSRSRRLHQRHGGRRRGGVECLGFGVSEMPESRELGWSGHA